MQTSVDARIARAVAAATAYAEQHDVDVFVVYADYAERAVTWLTAWDYYHGWGQSIREQDVIWNYGDGYY